jgi:hypothetical protein
MSETTPSKQRAIKSAVFVGLVCGVIGWLFFTPSHWGYYAQGTMKFTAIDSAGKPVSWGIRSGGDIMSGPKQIEVDITNSGPKNLWFYGLSGWIVFTFCMAVGFAGTRTVQALIHKKAQ